MATNDPSATNTTAPVTPGPSDGKPPEGATTTTTAKADDDDKAKAKEPAKEKAKASPAAAAPKADDKTKEKASDKPPPAPRDASEDIGDAAFAAAMKAGKTPEEASEIAGAAVRASRRTIPIDVDAAANPNGKPLDDDDDIPFPALRGQAKAFVEAFERAGTRMRNAKDLPGFLRAVRTFADEVEALAKDVDSVSKVEDGYKDEKIDVAGEGAFVVRRNGWIESEKKFREGFGKVELTATKPINGTGLQANDNFAEEPAHAVRLVLADLAIPRQRGGVRRVKGIAGEPSASAP